jgi:uncharacterized protein involved in outer membrane biogenesis
MRLRRAIACAAGIAALLVAGAAALLLSFDLDAYRGQVVAALAQAAGRPVAIEGGLSLSVSLRPKLVAEGATLGNPPGFSRPEMLKVRRLEARARLWPLLRGVVQIDRLTLEDVDLLLERGPDGRGNWVLGGGGPGASSPPPIGRLVVRDASIGWRAGDRVEALRIDELAAVEKDGALEAELSGAARDRPLRIKGRFAADLGQAAPVIAARDLSFAFGQIAGEGKLSIGWASGRPRLDGRLDIATLDLDRAFGTEPAPDDGRLVPDVSLDPALLEAADAALDLRIGRLVAAGRVLADVSGRLRVESGRLDASDLSAEFARGRLTGALQARRLGRGVKLRLQADLAQAELADLATGGPASGRIDAQARLEGEGTSLRAVASSLSGEARLIGRDGRISGYALDLAAADILRLLAPWTERGGETKVSCLLFASTIRRGRAKVDALAVDADRVLVTGEGTIDLGRERLDLKLTPRPKEPSLLSLATPIDVRGPLRDPSVTPDEAGLARGVAGALLGNLALPGAGFLLPFLSAGAGDHPCAQTLAARPSEAKPPGETGVGGFFRGLGRTIDRTLGVGR